MKFTVQREAFLKPLQFAAGVVEKRQTMPILSNLMLDVKEDYINLTGTDLEVELIGQCTDNLSVAEPGSTTIPARKLLDIFKNLPENSNITVSLSRNRVKISSGKSQFSLSALDASQYPSLEHAPQTNSFKIRQKDLKLLLTRTHFAMAQQDVRHYLNGMLLEVQNGNIRAVATDGHRIAINTINTPTGDLEVKALIPRKAVLELMRLLEDDDIELTIAISPNHLRAQTDEYTFTSKLLETNFPNYDRVIPQNCDKTVNLSRGEFRQRLSRASILSNEKYRGVRFKLDDNLLTLQANNPDQEEAQEEMSVDYQYPTVELGFNVDYLIDVMNTILTDTVNLAFSSNEGGVLVEDKLADCDSLFVVMPMRPLMTLLTHIAIANLRNLVDVELSPSPNCNVLFGNNGSGKTSFLEAIHYLALGRSFRTRHHNRVLQHEQDQFSVFCRLQHEDNNLPLGLLRTRSGESQIKLAGESTSINKIADLLPIQLIYPDGYQILSGGPKYRRQLLDWGVFHVERGFYRYWQRAQRAIKQRNQLLKSHSCPDAQLAPWEHELNEVSRPIDDARKAYLSLLIPKLQQTIAKMDLPHEISLNYVRGWDAEKELIECIEQSRQRDKQLGYTQNGPHKADIAIKIHGKPAYEVLSQGQQKLVTYAIKLSQSELLYEQNSKRCVYLIDDLPAELDPGKREILHTMLKNISAQVFITGIEQSSLGPFIEQGGTKLFHVERGAIIEA